MMAIKHSGRHDRNLRPEEVLGVRGNSVKFVCKRQECTREGARQRENSKRQGADSQPIDRFRKTVAGAEHHRCFRRAGPTMYFMGAYNYM